VETAKGECRQLERNPLRNTHPVKFPEQRRHVIIICIIY